MLNSASLPLAFGLPGGTELWIILFVVLILFGSKLPSLARNLGMSFKEFKKGVRAEDEEDPKALSSGDEPKKRIEGHGSSR
ncbi:MAG TPA: twin-arginine translocase TatA/TatE family subunit [Planctomycetota bacterium]|jgi:sec-independent protein translocase protein TatA|nr:twin-arginine translocase TatA/TatE family subunit [Planctomycetota bacterium]